jgi:hypothetical protein
MSAACGTTVSLDPTVGPVIVRLMRPGLNYPAGLSCGMGIVTPPDQPYTLSYEAVDIYRWTDSLAVYDGAFADMYSILDSTANEPLEVTSSAIWVEFNADANRQGNTGFTLVLAQGGPPMPGATCFSDNDCPHTGGGNSTERMTCRGNRCCGLGTHALCTACDREGVCSSCAVGTELQNYNHNCVAKIGGFCNEDVVSRPRAALAWCGSQRCHAVVGTSRGTMFPEPRGDSSSGLLSLHT